MTREELQQKSGTEYKCGSCGHTWDYDDDACPECGSWNIAAHKIHLTLPPAEGAKIRGDADAILSRFKDNVRGSVVTSYNIVFYEDAIQAMYEFAALQQPTAEGAEEIAQRCPVCGGNGLVPCGFYNQTSGHWGTTSITPETCRSCNGTGVVFATLHAQQIADKMVEERLREELIAYEIHWNFVLRDNAEKIVDEYLKSREK